MHRRSISVCKMAIHDEDHAVKILVIGQKPSSRSTHHGPADDHYVIGCICRSLSFILYLLVLRQLEPLRCLLLIGCNF